MVHQAIKRASSRAGEAKAHIDRTRTQRELELEEKRQAAFKQRDERLQAFLARKESDSRVIEILRQGAAHAAVPAITAGEPPQPPSATGTSIKAEGRGRVGPRPSGAGVVKGDGGGVVGGGDSGGGDGPRLDLLKKKKRVELERKLRGQVSDAD